MYKMYMMRSQSLTPVTASLVAWAAWVAVSAAGGGCGGAKQQPTIDAIAVWKLVLVSLS